MTLDISSHHDWDTLEAIDAPRFPAGGQVLHLGARVAVTALPIETGEHGTLTGISVRSRTTGERTCTVTRDDGTDLHVFARHLEADAGNPPGWMSQPGDRVAVTTGDGHCGTVRAPRSGLRTWIELDTGDSIVVPTVDVIPFARITVNTGRNPRSSTTFAEQLRQVYPNSRVVDTDRDVFGNCWIALEAPVFREHPVPDVAGT